MSNIGQWINERWPFQALFRLGLEEEIPGGPSYAYTFGSAALALFILQVVTGIFQLFYYVPTVDHAYDSVSYLRIQVPFGWLIHNLHHWGNNAMIVLVTVHMIRVFIWGAYKQPRELIWLSGVGLFILTAALSFTGAPLPWDEMGYWAAEVGTNVAGTVPLTGDFFKRLLRGGEAMGQLTLSRFFIMHVAILPILLFSLVAFHLIAFRQFGSVGPWKEEKRRITGPFWPDQLFEDFLTGAFLLLIIIALAAYSPQPFYGPADPIDTSYIPKSEWNFLFFYETLKFFHGKLEPYGTIGIPLAGILLLLLLPFLDRGPERNPVRRPLSMTFGFLILISVTFLTVKGYYSKPVSSSARSSPERASGVSANAAQGEKLFHSLGCIGCHSVNGKGGNLGPDLSNEAGKGRSREWLIDKIRNPKLSDPKTIMPAFTQLTGNQLNSLADYLLGLRGSIAEIRPPQGESAASQPKSSSATPVTKEPGPAAFMIGNPGHGNILFNQDCASCHGPGGGEGVPNPGSSEGEIPRLHPVNPTLFNSRPLTFAENIDKIIQYGSVPSGPNPAIKMPAFKDTLTQQQIAQIEAYVLALNGVNRAQIENPGMKPEHFFFLALFVFGFVGLILTGMRLYRRS